MSNAKALKRIPSIDRFRGTVIFSMIIFQFIEYFKNLGAAANIALHAPKEDAFYILPNFAIADIIAPMFILAIGLTYIPSLKRRIERDGKKKASIHFVGRYLTLIGIGMTMDGVNDLLGGKDNPVEKVCKIVSLIVVVLLLLYGVLRLFKAKKIAHYIGVALGAVVVLYGVFGIVLAAVNGVMLVSGKTGDSYHHWMVLHHIGFAGLVALPFALIDGKRATLIRFISAAVILALFTLFHESSFSWTQFPNNMELVDKVADGGILGGFAWGAMLILYLAFSDLYYKGKKAVRDRARSFCADNGGNNRRRICDSARRHRHMGGSPELVPADKQRQRQPVVCYYLRIPFSPGVLDFRSLQRLYAEVRSAALVGQKPDSHVLHRVRGNRRIDCRTGGFL